MNGKSHFAKQLNVYARVAVRILSVRRFTPANSRLLEFNVTMRFLSDFPGSGRHNCGSIEEDFVLLTDALNGVTAGLKSMLDKVNATTASVRLGTDAVRAQNWESGLCMASSASLTDSASGSLLTIINGIEDLACITNLLACNAAIEAEWAKAQGY